MNSTQEILLSSTSSSCTWENFISNTKQFCNLDERMIFVIGIVLFHSITFWTYQLFLYTIYSNNLYPELKIQKKPLDSVLTRKAAIKTLISHFLSEPLFSYLMYPYLTQVGILIHAPLPSFLIATRDLFICMFVCDTLTYWLHRMLHHSYLYKYFHKQHHEFKVNFSIASEYTDPVDELFLTLIPTLSPPILLAMYGGGFHYLQLVSWIAIRSWESLDDHSGMYFKWCPFGWIRSPERHDFHHSHNVGCYSAFFWHWDYLMGTDKIYREYKSLKLLKSKIS